MTKKLPQFEDYLLKVQQWMEQCALASSELAAARPWCTLGIDKGLTEKNLADAFTRGPLNEKYTEEYNKATDSGPPFAFLQLEVDLIYSMHRCFTARHRGRLMSYRDDCVQKNYRNHTAISLGNAKFEQLKTEAERLVAWQSQA